MAEETATPNGEQVVAVMRVPVSGGRGRSVCGKDRCTMHNLLPLGPILALSLAHLAITAFRAISFLCSAESRAARILPPFEPPSLPKATALGFFFFPINCSNLSHPRTEINIRQES